MKEKINIIMHSTQKNKKDENYILWVLSKLKNNKSSKQVNIFLDIHAYRPDLLTVIRLTNYTKNSIKSVSVIKAKLIYLPK